MGIDDLQAELIKEGCEELSEMPTSLCRKIWQTKQWPREWLHSLVVALLKEGNSQKSENYQTICLICQVSKVMLKVLQRLPTAAADEILAEEEAVGESFSTTVGVRQGCTLFTFTFHDLTISSQC